MSAKNEMKLAIANSATQDDFKYLQETMASKNDIELLKVRVQDIGNKVSEFKDDDDDISLSDDEADSEEHMDDVMAIDGQKDDLLQEDGPDQVDDEIRRNRSWKSDVSKMGIFDFFNVYSWNEIT
jgi:hypothetical protein